MCNAALRETVVAAAAAATLGPGYVLSDTDVEKYMCSIRTS